MSTRLNSYDSAKAAIDVAAALALLVVAAPLIALTAAVVRVGFGAPILYRQVRAGRGGRTFTVLKFRTMTDQRDAEGRLLPDDRRLTPLGRWLRATSLDELPQLWNVVRGNMSLVGPRPLLPEYLPRYSAYHARRHDVRPGITGWAQVNGRAALSWDEKLDLDVWYVEHRSLALDLRILWRTLLTVATRRDTTGPGNVVFEGSGERRA